MRKIAVAAVLAPLMTGCASLQPDNAQPLQFDYVTSVHAASGLVRVFSLNGNTILQFVNLAKIQPKVYAPGSAKPLAYSVVGQYAVLPGQHRQLTIEANGFRHQALHVTSNSVASSANNSSGPDALATQQVQDVPAPASMAPAHEPHRTWTLTGGMTLHDNLKTLARRAGFSDPIWNADNPYMIVSTTEYTGTFTEVLKHISAAAPALDFVVDPRQRTIEVANARS